MNYASFVAWSLIFGASPVLANSPFNDSRSKCTELAQSYNGVNGHGETIAFRNSNGQQQNVKIYFKLKEEGCKSYPDRASFVVKKLVGSKVDTWFDVRINQELTGDDRVRVTSMVSNCEKVGVIDSLKREIDARFYVNKKLEAQTQMITQREFCPPLLEGVKKSILNHFKNI